MYSRLTTIYDAVQKAWRPVNPDDPQEMWLFMGCAMNDASTDTCACEGDKEDERSYEDLIQSELNNAKGG